MLRDHVQNDDPIFRHAALGMALISLHGTFIMINPALCDLLGHPQHDIDSTAPLDHTYKDLLADIRRFGEALANERNISGRFERPLDQVSGQRLTVTIHVSLIRDKDALPLHYLVQFENRTPLLEIEEKLKATEFALTDIHNSYYELLEKMPLAVLITKKGIIQYANPAALRLVHAQDRSEALGLSTNMVVDATYHTALEERRKIYDVKKALNPIVYLINCMDGRQKYVEGFTLIINYEGEHAAVNVFKDITDQKQREEYMMQSEKLTMAGQLAAGIAHEIRNPLTSINGFMKLIRSSKRSPETYYEIIESELKRIELIVNELLVLSKPQGKHVSKPINVLPMLEQVITLMNVQAALKNIEITLERADVPQWIVGETNQLKQVFINLLKNGMDAMDSSGTIRVSVDSTEQEVWIRVQDEGSGMTPEQVQKLGQPFFTTKDTGTGLGFMITQNIIHNHGGSIQIESEPGQGTAFTVKLPKTMKPEYT
ncbi:ATP-binding protein [Paenibacillus sp. FSL W8-0194]|uniref:ATP-binding protein n=1 Tax=Paenibacillus sp. FSL W8-0194 TaxID=2921711 RepID=UPI0030D8D76E